MDRSPHQTVDLHELLDSTLVMLARKIPPGVRVVKEYDASMPAVPAYAAELNQVWTNIIDNALQAMDGTGTLTLSTHADAEFVIVRISDNPPPGEGGAGPAAPEPPRRCRVRDRADQRPRPRHPR